MEMHGSALMFGVGELVVVAILHNKTLEVDGRTMAHFFIFEAVIIMSRGPDDDHLLSWSTCNAIRTYVWVRITRKKSGIEDLSHDFCGDLDPLLLFLSLSWPSSASRIPSRCRLRVYSLINGS
jgi:hypothetical protein